MPSLFGGTVYKSVRCPFCGSDLTAMSDEPELCPNCKVELSDGIIAQLSEDHHSPFAYPNPDDSSKRAKDGPPHAHGQGELPINKRRTGGE